MNHKQNKSHPARQPFPPVCSVNPHGAAPRSLLHLLTPWEIKNLQDALAHSRIPLDLQAKLTQLRGDNLLHAYIEQHSRLFLALILAAYADGFKSVTPANLDRLLRVLAYVRKDNDAIPDFQHGGYVDDHLEVQAACRDLHALLNKFKLWKLRHEVPRRWLHANRHQPSGSSTDSPLNWPDFKMFL